METVMQFADSVMSCPECGGAIPVDSRFCKDCGVRLAEKSIHIVGRRVDLICPGCGSIMLHRLSYYFCPRDELLVKKV